MFVKLLFRKCPLFLSASVLSSLLVFHWVLTVPATDLPGTGDDKGKTVVYRDTWGVPHIYAPTIEAGLFAMGWAQAEDRPEELLKNLLRGTGELASVEGPSGLDNDRMALMQDLYAGSKRMADSITPEVRRHVQAFVRGINSYYQNHPGDIPSWWEKREVDEFMVIAYARLFLQSYAFDEGLRDVKRTGIDPGMEPMFRGSNQFSVAPSRTAVGAPILLGDMHLSWDGPYRFWECRIHAGELKGSGFTLPGVPYIGVGHNDCVAWSMTTGGPDAGDAYELKLDNDGASPTKYFYAGQWRELKQREYRVRVKGSGEKTIRFYDSHYGPLVAIGKGKAYAIRSSYVNAGNVLAPWYEYLLARDYRGIEKGLALLQLYPHNVMVADNSGNIYYQRAGRVPRRPDGYEWSKPVDGSSSRTEWLGLHPSSDLVQVLNPPQGYMQNCNVPPDAMMEGSPFRLVQTVPYIFADMMQQEAWGYSTRDGWINSRGARVLELLKADSTVTIEDAMSIANDIQPYGARYWVELLLDADQKYRASHRTDTDYVAGIQDLAHWDFELAVSSKAALKYAYWRIHLAREVGSNRLNSMAHRVENLRASLGEPPRKASLSSEELRLLASSFANAMSGLKSDFGSIEKPYGEVFRVGRGNQSWPCEGGMSEFLGLTTLRSVQYGPERRDHTRWGQTGQTSATLVVLTRPIQSWTSVPLGQSDRPDSPHYSDQAEHLFSQRKMKPTWWTPEELAGHIESRAEIKVPL